MVSHARVAKMGTIYLEINASKIAQLPTTMITLYWHALHAIVVVKLAHQLAHIALVAIQDSTLIPLQIYVLPLLAQQDIMLILLQKLA